MVFHMKTTLNIDGKLMARLKQEAARSRTTMSQLVEAALRSYLSGLRKPARDLADLPDFDSGGALVDISNRESLYDQMER